MGIDTPTNSYTNADIEARCSLADTTLLVIHFLIVVDRDTLGKTYPKSREVFRLLWKWEIEPIFLLTENRLWSTPWRGTIGQ